MNETAIISDPESSKIFMLLDVHLEVIEDALSSEKIVQSLLQNGYKFLFITETIASSVPSFLKTTRNTHDAIIVVIPGVDSEGKMGEEMLTQLRRAVIGQ